MMKRVLRNGLCQILLNSIQRGKREDIFLYLRSLCQVHRLHGSSILPVRIPKTRFEVRIKKIMEVKIFDIDVDPEFGQKVYLHLKPELQPEMNLVCKRVDQYESVFSCLEKNDEPDDSLNQVYRMGALLFNHGLYFESHEYLEGFWKSEQGDRKTYLQGIICLATALYHIEKGNVPSALILFEKGTARLKTFDQRNSVLEFNPLFLKIKTIKRMLNKQGITEAQKFISVYPPAILIHSSAN